MARRRDRRKIKVKQDDEKVAVPFGIATSFFPFRDYTAFTGQVIFLTVYLDVAFALNATVNYCLLTASGRLGGGELSACRLIPAAALGGFYSVFALFPGLSFLNFFGMKILVSVLMLVLAFRIRMRTVRIGVLFWALSFCFAGAVLIATKLFRSDLLLLGGGVYYPVSAFGLMLVAAVGYTLARLGFSGLCIHTDAQIVPLRLSFGKYTAEVRALLDTGNTLRDPLTNEAVTVVNWEVLCSFLPHLHLHQEEFLKPTVLMEKLSVLAPGLKTRLIPYKAVGVQTGFLLAAKLDELNGGKPILTAFSPNTVSDGGNYEALIGEVL